MSATALLLDRLRVALAPQYLVEREIGGGGMGIVFRGRDPHLDRAVAIKVLRPELASAQAAARFLREARLLAQIRHLGIVPVYLAGESDGLFFYVMDLLERSTLADRLELGPLPADEVVVLGRQLLAALACAHGQGVVHRDVKPANIFLQDDHALLGDFGVARTADETTLTAPGALIGTPAYGAPEQLAGAPATERSDLYSVGATLYEAATGRRWRAMDPASPATWAGVSGPLRSALQRALALDPADRWSDAIQFAHALEVRQGHRLARWPRIAAAVGGAGLLAWLTTRWIAPSAALPPAHPATADLAILPFTGAADFSYRLARYTTSRIEWFPRVTLQPFVHSAAVDDSLRRAGRPVRGVDLRTALYVEGEVIQRDGRPVLQLEIRDSSDRLVRVVEVPGESGDELAWSHAAADSLVAAAWPQYLTQFRELTSGGMRNLPAVRELVAGEDAFQLGEWDQAEHHYRQALDFEPGFAEALWKLMLLRRWKREPFDDVLQQLRRSGAEELPGLYRRLTAIQLEPDLDRRITQFREVAAEYPRSEVANFLYLNERFHRGPLVGVPLRPTLDLIMAGSGSNTYISQALADQTVWGFIRLGDEARAHAYLERRRATAARRAGAESRDRVNLLRLAYWARFQPLRATIARRALMWAADSAYLDKLGKMFRLAAVFDLPDLELALGHDLAGRGSSPAARANGYLGQAVARHMLGQPASALGVLDSGLALLDTPEARVQRGEWRLIPVALGLPGIPAGELAWARHYLEGFLAEEDTALQVRAAWALALDAHARQDTVTRARFHALVHGRADREATAARLDGILESIILASHGQLAEALARSAPLVTYDSAGQVGGPFARAVLYLYRGEWLARAGRWNHARLTWQWWQNSDVHNWPEHEPQAAEVDAMVSVYARLRLVEAAAGLDVRTTCADLRRVQALWREAQPAVRFFYDHAAAVRRCASRA